MKRNLGKWVISATFAIMAFAITAYPQEPARNDEQGVKNGMVNVVVFKVTGPENIMARASVIEGGSLKIEDPKSGVTYAFFPALDKKNKKNVLIKVCNVSREGTSDRFDEIERMEILLGASSKSLMTTPQFKIEIEAIAKHIIKNGQRFNAPKKIDNVAAKAKP